MLLEVLILQMCSELSGVDYEVCTKSMEAASIQSSFKQEADTLEKNTLKFAEKNVAEVTGEKALIVLAFTAKVVHDKELTTKITKNNGIIPSINTSIGTSNGKLTFGWSF